MKNQLIILLILFHHKNKVEKIKREIQYVTYRNISKVILKSYIDLDTKNNVRQTLNYIHGHPTVPPMSLLTCIEPITW